MAKKKVSHSHQEKPSQKQDGFVVKSHQEVTPAMDSEASEKFESLKSLNQMLLKEAVERRQQVDSLVQSKGSLEMELTRSNSEREALRSELTQLGDQAARMELERVVVAVFVAAQVGLKGELIQRKLKGLEAEMRNLTGVIDEKECEIGRLKGELSEIQGALGNEREISQSVRLERDEMEDRFNKQIKEAKGLRENFIALEKRKKATEQEIGELRALFAAVVGEKEESEMRIESIKREKDSIARGLSESNKLIEEMKEELRGVVNEKKGIEAEKNAEMVKRNELENAVSGLNELVVDLQKEEEKLRANVVELEKKCVQGEERQKEMGREIDQLLEERKLSEKRVEELVGKKIGIEKDLSEVLKQLDEQKHIVEEMVAKRNVMMEAKSRLDSEVVSLQNEVAELKDVVLRLEESNLSEVVKIKNLESEVREYRHKLEQVKVERDEMESRLNDEEENGVRLNKKIGQLEDKIVESMKNVEEIKGKNAVISAEKVDLEGRCEMQKKEIISLENKVNEARNKFDSLKGKLELADADSKRVLNMLKETATFCSKDEESNKQINGEEAKGHVMEFEMIKNAFKNKESQVENMKRQVELLNNSVEDAHKKKSFWTVLSSATTLLAAISLAYIARGAH